MIDKKRVEEVAAATGKPKKMVREVIKAHWEAIADALREGERVPIPGYVTIEPVARKGRAIVDAATGEVRETEPAMSVRFKMGSNLKKMIRSAKIPDAQ